MTDKILIGKVCYKGNHPSFDGEADYGTCGSHYYADIYLTVEKTSPGRGDEPNLKEIAEDVARAFKDAEEAGWDSPNSVSSFQDLGDGAYRVSGARVSPTTGRYVTSRDNS